MASTRNKSRAILIRPHQRMNNGIAVFIGEERDEEGKWSKVRPLPHIPYTKVHGRPIFHSPDGFELGYTGSGPADLSLAICNLFGKGKLYQEFKVKVVAGLKRKDYDIPFTHIELLLEKISKGESL